MTKERKKLETVLGYYSFGQDYTNLAASDDRSRYVSVHEFEHAKLGTSSYFGLFQQFLAYLSSSSEPRAGGVGRELFAQSIEAVLDVHEATATYCEFTYAKFNNFEKIDEMERDLPLEYRRWRGFYGGVFGESLSLDIRAVLASLLSRHAMNTSILLDYATPSSDKFLNFESYLKKPEKSPNQRFYNLIEFVKSEDQEKIFQNFLTCYRNHSEELLSLYDDQTVQNRKRSFQINGELYWAFARDRATMPYPDGIIDKGSSYSFTRDMDHLVSEWVSFFSKKFAETIHFKVHDTDILEWDVMLEREVVSFTGSPQTNLVEIASVRGINDASSYIVWITEWDEDTPFVLSTVPDRKIAKGGYYYRYLPLDPSGQPAYVLNEDQVDIPFLEKSEIGAVFLKGWNITPLLKLYETMSAKCPTFVHWRSWSELNMFLDGANCTELGIVRISEASAMIAIRTKAHILHLLLCIGGGCSLATNAVLEANDGIRPLKASNREAAAIRTILLYGDTVLGR